MQTTDIIPALMQKKLFALFFVSGFCGLLYQVIWVRLAFGHFGVITPVLSVIVSVFMLGLAIGSWVAGKWLAPLARHWKISPIYFYALAELLIGVGAFTVPSLFGIADAWLLPGGAMDSGAYLFRSSLAITLTLLPWCCFMGATFPLAVSFVEGQDETQKTTFSYLYLANVIGAVLGTILTADVLVELLGFRQTLAVAGVANFVIAGLSATLGRTSAGYGVKLSARASTEAAHSEHLTSTWKTMALLFVTGFTSMGAEVVWTRAFTPILNTTIYAFALILAIYLAATALGSFLYRRHLRQHRVVSNTALMGALAMSSFFPIVFNDPRIDLRTLGVELGIFPWCAVLGYLTPKLIDQFSQGSADKVGRAYAVNVVGCILGPLFASYWILPQYGVKVSMVILAVPYFLMFSYYAARRATAHAGAVWTLTLVLLLCSIFVNQSHEEKYPGGIIRRDYTATVVSAGQGLDKHLYVNGQGITTLCSLTKVMAHLPMGMFAEKPKQALIICFGMGTTFRSMLTWNVPTTAVELVPSVEHAFSYYHADGDAVMKNPNGKVVIDDGRRFLKRTNQVFDVVTLDPPPPVEAAGSSLLYSEGFYDLVKARLSEHGVLQQWFPGNEGVEAQAIARAIKNSFPYVRVYKSLYNEGLHFYASRKPLPIPTAAQWIARMPAAAKSDLVEWEKDKLSRVVDRILGAELSLNEVMGQDPRIVITDDRPFNEYYMLRRSKARFKREHPRLASWLL